jgi:hypothetical protein
LRLDLDSMQLSLRRTSRVACDFYLFCVVIKTVNGTYVIRFYSLRMLLVVVGCQFNSSSLLIACSATPSLLVWSCSLAFTEYNSTQRMLAASRRPESHWCRSFSASWSCLLAYSLHDVRYAEYRVALLEYICCLLTLCVVTSDQQDRHLHP